MVSASADDADPMGMELASEVGGSGLLRQSGGVLPGEPSEGKRQSVADAQGGHRIFRAETAPLRVACDVEAGNGVSVCIESPAVVVAVDAAHDDEYLPRNLSRRRTFAGR